MKRSGLKGKVKTLAVLSQIVATPTCDYLNLNQLKLQFQVFRSPATGEALISPTWTVPV